MPEETNDETQEYSLPEALTRPELHTTGIPLYTIHNLTTMQPIIKMYFPTTVKSLFPSTAAESQNTRDTDWGGEVTSTPEAVTDVSQELQERDNKTALLHSRQRVPSPLQSLENLFQLIGSLRGQVGKTRDKEEEKDKQEGIQDEHDTTTTKIRPENTWHNVPYSLTSTLASMFPSLPNFFGIETINKHPDTNNMHQKYRHKIPQRHPQNRFSHINKFPSFPPHTRMPPRVDLHPFLKAQRNRNRHHKPLFHPGPTIIVKKDGARLHIPVMPSADFSSFKPQYNTRETTFKQRPQGDWKTGGATFGKNSGQNTKPKQRPHDTNERIKPHTTSNAVHNNSQFPPSDKSPHGPPFLHIIPPNPSPFIPQSIPPYPPFIPQSSIPPNPSPFFPHTTPPDSTPFTPSSSLVMKKCKPRLLERLGNLLTNNHNNYRFEVGVYSSVVER